MISFTLAVIFLIAFVISFKLGNERKIKARYSGHESWQDSWVAITCTTGLLAFCFWIGTFIGLFVGINTYTSSKNETRAAEDQLDNAVALRDDVFSTFQATLEEYPGLEADTFKNLDPEIALAYPELKASSTLMAIAESYYNATEAVKNRQNECVDTYTDVANTFSDLLITPKYLFWMDWDTPEFGEICQIEES